MAVRITCSIERHIYVELSSYLFARRNNECQATALIFWHGSQLMFLDGFNRLRKTRYRYVNHNDYSKYIDSNSVHLWQSSTNICFLTPSKFVSLPTSFFRQHKLQRLSLGQVSGGGHNIRMFPTSIGILIIEIRGSLDRLVYTMEIPYLG